MSEEQSLLEEPIVLNAQRGDFLFAERAIPEIDNILTKSDHKEANFRLDTFRSYLDFLEIVVLNERLIIGIDETIENLDPACKKSKAMDVFTQYRLTGLLDIEKEVFDKLLNREIIQYAEIVESNNSPRSYAERFLNISVSIQNQFNEIKEYAKHYDNDEFVTNEIAVASLTNKFGFPYHLSEFARLSQIPFLLSKREVANLSQIESIEIKLQRNVQSCLVDNLNKGAREEVKRLSELGVTTVFPETPISWQIISESKAPEDLLIIALQLRDEYKSFRSNMIKIEAELFSDVITLKRKKKLLDEIQSLAFEIWQNSHSGLRKETSELSGLLNIAATTTDIFSTGGITKLTQQILSHPLELILKQLRRRKIRVLLRAKKNFLNSKSWSDKIGEIFNIPVGEIRAAIEKQSQSI